MKQKVKQANQYKQVQLHLSGDKLLVRQGGGFEDFLEWLNRKGFI